MSDQIIIYVPTISQNLAESAAQWVLVDQKLSPKAAVQYGTLQHAADFLQSRRCHLILGAEEIVMSEAKIPGGNAKRAAAAIPFTLEDQYATDIDALHFAIGARQGADLFPVITIDDERLTILRDELLALHILPSAIAIDAQLIPFQQSADNTSHWSAVMQDQRFILRQHLNTGLAVPDIDTGWLIKQLLQDLETEEQAVLTLYHSHDLDMSSAQLPSDERLTVELKPIESVLTLLVSALTENAINLLQGKHSLKEQFDQYWRPWRATAILTAFTVTLWSGTQFYQLQKLSQKQQNLEQQSLQTVRAVFPKARDTGDPIRDMKSRLRKLRGGNASSELLPVLDIIGASKKQGSNVALNSVNFRNDKFDLDLKIADLNALDALKQSFESGASLKAKIQSATPQDGQIRGRIRLESK